MFSTRSFIALLSFFFLVDMVFYGFLGFPYSFLRITFFYALVGTGIAFWWLMLLGIAVSYDSLLLTGVIGRELALMVPLGLLLSFMRQHIALATVVEALALVVCVEITALGVSGEFSVPHIDLLFFSLHFLSALSMVYLRKR